MPGGIVAPDVLALLESYRPMLLLVATSGPLEEIRLTHLSGQKSMRSGSTQPRQQPPPSAANQSASLIPGRAFLFVLSDEVNPVTRKVVRKVMVNPRMAEA